MNSAKNNEKRRHERVGFSTPIRAVLSAGGRQIEVAGDSKDLSLKGVFIVTDEKLAKGTECAVKIFLTGGVDEIELAMEAEVIRAEDNGMALIFKSMDVDSFTHLKNIVKYNSLKDEE